MAREAQGKPGRGLQHRLLGWAGWLLLAYGSVAVVIAFVLPDFVRQQAEEALTTASFTARIDNLQLNPLRLQLTASGVALEQAGAVAPLQLESLRINLSLESLLRAAVVFDQVALHNPSLLARLDREGQLNWLLYLDELLPEDEDAATETQPQEEGGLPRLLVRDIQLRGIQLAFIDEGKKETYSETFGPLDMAVSDLSTIPRPGAPYVITASTSRTETIEWRGELELNPLRSHGSLVVGGWQLPLVWEYFKEGLNFEVAEGVGALRLDYRYDGNLTLSKGEVAFEALRLLDRQPQQEALVELPSLRLDGIEFDLDGMSLAVAGLAVAGLEVGEVISPAGESRLALAFTPVAGESAVAAADPHGEATDPGKAAPPAADDGVQPFEFSLAAATIEEAVVSVRHQLGADQAIDLSLGDIAVELQDFRWPEGTIGGVTLRAVVNETAELAVEATGEIEPLHADYSVALEGFELAVLGPYLSPYLSIDLAQGLFDAKLEGSFDLQDGVPGGAVGGELGLRELSLNDTAKGAPIISFDALQVEQLALGIEPLTVAVEKVRLQQPFAKVVIYEDGSTNLSRLAVEQPAQPAAEAVSEVGGETVEPDAGAMPSIEIASIELHDGTADFADLSLPRDFRAAIYDIEGGVEGISSSTAAPARVDITGAVDRYAPVTLQGEIQPLSEDLHIDLALAFRNMELTTVSPYADTYAGYNIDKGKLNADFEYLIQGSQLQAQNRLMVDQLTLGERTESDLATSLPVAMAIALLKDKNGVIDIDLPVSGEIDDPEFSYGALVGKALLNLVTKIVTSPFAALGKLVGGGEDMDYVPFEPGQAELGAEDASKLTRLAEALNERPQLELSIRGVAAQEADAAALQEQRLREQMTALGVQVPVPEDSWKPVFKQYKKTMGVNVKTIGKELDADGKFDEAALQQATRERVWQDLLDNEEVTPADLEQLARARAELVRETLVGAGVEPARIFLLDPEVAAGADVAPHGQLELDAG